MNLNYKYLILIAVIIAAIILGGGGYFYYQTQQKQTVKINPQASAQEETKKIIAEVGTLIDLPVGEDPAVATVTDVTKLKDQPFFQKAKNGDKVLIYTNAKKAILYDPNLKKVLDVAPINIGTSSAEASQPRIVFKNGTSKAGLTNKVETELKKTIPQLNVISKENAEAKTYEKTTVVVINGSGKDMGERIAKALDTTVGTLPAGEVAPKDAEIMVILGKDRI